MALWTFCECCYEEDEEEEEENRLENTHSHAHTHTRTIPVETRSNSTPFHADIQHRNLTWQAQVVVWSLAIAVVAVVIVLIILVGMLLGANSWMAHGVERGNNVVRRTIPQVSKPPCSRYIILIYSPPPLSLPLSLPPSLVLYTLHS